MYFTGYRIHRIGSTSWSEDAYTETIDLRSESVPYYRTIWNDDASWYFPDRTTLLVQASTGGNQQYFGLMGTLYLYGY